MDKSEILKKLFNDEHLSSQEAVFVGENLKDGVFLPYDHSRDDVMGACGVTHDDIKEMNDLFSGNVAHLSTKSEVVEATEKIVLSNPKFTRLMVIQSLELIRKVDTVKDSIGHTLATLLEKEIKSCLKKKRGRKKKE